MFRQLAQEMKEVAAQRQQEEEAFYRQQELMIDAENQRRSMIGQEEQKLADQRSRFVILKRRCHLYPSERRRGLVVGAPDLQCGSTGFKSLANYFSSAPLVTANPPPVIWVICFPLFE